MMSKSTGYPLLFAALLALGGAGCSAPSENACADDGVVASEAWVRATRHGQKMSAAYVRLCNGAGASDRLVAISFDGAQAAELHSSMTEDGVASMAPLPDGLELPPNEMVDMAPGGAHIMLIGLDHALNEGDDPSITLQFANAPAQTIKFEVRAGHDGGH